MSAWCPADRPGRLLVDPGLERLAAGDREQVGVLLEQPGHDLVRPRHQLSLGAYPAVAALSRLGLAGQEVGQRVRPPGGEERALDREQVLADVRPPEETPAPGRPTRVIRSGLRLRSA